MTAYKAEFIKVHTEVGWQTLPTEPDKRLSESEVRLQLCVEEDVNTIASAIYDLLPQAWWDRKQPPSPTLPPLEERKARLAQRLLPTFRDPKVHVDWVKAIHVPSSTIIGIAGWWAPGNPVHNCWRRTAVDYYDWKTLMNWTDADVEDLWVGIDFEAWDGEMARHDEARKGFLGDEKHWYLAPLLIFPEWQGKGVGSRLLRWAIDQADKADPIMPLWLESAPTARGVYLNWGFEPVGETRMLRRGPGRKVDSNGEVLKNAERSEQKQ
ncbi:unnamed protein product [Periconia digitata]|uniref:N-acetyltransferase domain-containing protein n=1 Tax=Periconia digitata TaxID=1303443 RepID=A0A9W4UHK4_9PLEO|nr:unnamed protein product [Periconia digitata]